MQLTFFFSLTVKGLMTFENNSILTHDLSQEVFHLIYFFSMIVTLKTGLPMQCWLLLYIYVFLCEVPYEDRTCE